MGLNIYCFVVHLEYAPEQQAPVVNRDKAVARVYTVIVAPYLRKMLEFNQPSAFRSEINSSPVQHFFDLMHGLSSLMDKFHSPRLTACTDRSKTLLECENKTRTVLQRGLNGIHVRPEIGGATVKCVRECIKVLTHGKCLGPLRHCVWYTIWRKEKIRTVVHTVIDLERRCAKVSRTKGACKVLPVCH